MHRQPENLPAQAALRVPSTRGRATWPPVAAAAVAVAEAVLVAIATVAPLALQPLPAAAAPDPSVWAADNEEVRRLVDQMNFGKTAVMAGASQALREALARGDKRVSLRQLRVLAIGQLSARDFTSLTGLVEQGMPLARELEQFEALAEFMSYKALVSEARGMPAQAIVQIEEAISLVQRYQLRSPQGVLNYRLGGIYDSLGRKSEAVEAFNRAFAFTGKHSTLALGTLLALGNIYNKDDSSDAELDRAADYYRRALGVSGDRPSARWEVLVGLGNIQQKRRDFAGARALYEQAFALSGLLNIDDRIIRARLARDEGHWAAALRDMDGAVEASRKNNDLASEADIELDRAEVLAHLGRARDAMDALARVNGALPKLDSLRFEAVVHRRAGGVHELLGDYRQAYREALALNATQQRLQQAANEGQAEELRARFDTRLKDAENELLRARQQQQETRQLALAGLLALSLLLLALTAILLRKRAATARANAEHHHALALAEARRADAEASANQAKSAFLANMSHELRSPLNAMLGFGRLLLRDPTLGERTRHDATIILKSGEHLHALINQVLELSKIEAGRAALAPVALDLDALLDELESMFTLEARRKGLQLTIEAAPDAPRHVEIDALKLRQVLVNLLSNALKFTAQGHVALRVRAQVPAQAQAHAQANVQAQAQLSFQVSDTGVGIAAAEQAQLGEAFAQAQAGREAAEGTGLGLAISRSLVRLMGGELVLHSEMGVGTTLSFAVPVRVLDAAGLVAPATPTRRVIGLADAAAAPPRILVVDDWPEGRMLLVRLLQPLGFELREAANGEEALAQWRAWSPQLILMDMRMPVMDGREATRRIKATEQGRATIVIALTASSFEEQREEILAQGCDDFLRKPFVEEALLQMMAMHLNLAYRYEEESAAAAAPALDAGGIDAARLAALPASVKSNLQEALARLDVQAIDEALQAVHAHDAELAAALAPLAARFQYGRIEALLAKAQAPAGVRPGR